MLARNVGQRCSFIKGMPPDDAKHLRDRALECRNLVKGARNPADAAMLDQIAKELEAEARKIDAEAKLKDA